MEEKLAELNMGLNVNKLSNSSIREVSWIAIKECHCRRFGGREKSSLNETKSIEDEETECRRSGSFFGGTVVILSLYFNSIRTCLHSACLNMVVAYIMLHRSGELQGFPSMAAT